MLILSQDKTTIVNFNNKEDLFLDEDYYEGKFQGIKIISIGKMGTFLGLYATKKRAKEVLQEIIDAYKKSRFIELDSIKAENRVVYEMPEK